MKRTSRPSRRPPIRDVAARSTTNLQIRTPAAARPPKAKDSTMSGIGGFVPISSNTVHQQPAIQPGGVEPPRNAPVPNEPPQNAPVGNAGNDAATKELVRSLDVLLSRAGKAAGQAIDDAAIAKLAKGAKFDKATVEALRTTATSPNRASSAAAGSTPSNSSPSRTVRSASSSPSSPDAWPRKTAPSSTGSTTRSRSHASTGPSTGRPTRSASAT